MEPWIPLGVAVLAGAAAIAFALLRFASALNARRMEAETIEARLKELTAAQNEIAGRFSQAIESQSQGQTDISKTLAERLDALGLRMGTSLKETAEKTAETLGNLQERLSVIDEARKNITALSGEVVNLQRILDNKQARGAFGQGQMEVIVRDGLPSSLYEFQATLSNGTRPDCLIRLPNADAAIVIDSKFPLEAFAALKGANSDEERKLAAAGMRSDVLKHVKDIAGKYILPGETQSPAIMFVPSEAIYAELHDVFPDLIQRAYRDHVMIVSPSILMLAVNTVQTVMKDARMREQANLIQKEVGLLLQDVNRLQGRVDNLRRHFDQAGGDIKEITTSSEKIARRASAIEEVEIAPLPSPEKKDDTAKLRLVPGDGET